MNSLLRRSKSFCKRNSATILTCIGGVGVITTSVLAVKATPKALLLLEEAEKEKGEELTKLEKVVVAGPSYIPTVLVGIGTIACVFGANALNKRQQASLMSAYALLDAKYKDHKEKVEELYGKDANHKIKEAVANDKYEEQEVQKDEDDGKNLFYDEYSQRFFKASNETVLSAEYVINKTLAEDCGVCLNDLYDLFEIEAIPGGDDIGWSAAQMFEMYWSSWIDFYHSKAAMEDGTEYFIIDFTEPTPDFLDY